MRIHDVEMLDAPEAFLRRLAPRQRIHADVAAIGEVDTPQRLEDAARWLVAYAPEAWQNSHGDATTFQVAQQVKDRGVSEPMCLQLMVKWWNDVKAFPPWNVEDLELKVANAYLYSVDPIGISTPEGMFAVGDEPAPKSNGHDKRPPRLFIRSFEDSAARGLSNDFNALVDGYLERNALSVLYGKSGAGKTFVSLDYAYHVAAKRPWHGHRVTGGAVVYVAAEAGESINARIAALNQHYKPDRPVPLGVVPCLVDLFSPGVDLTELTALIVRWAETCGERVALIVLDTLARVIGPGDENSARDMGILIANLDRLRVAIEAHVMLVHHSGKNKAYGARGSSALRAAADTELEIEGGRIKVKKQRATEELPDVSFRLHRLVIGEGEHGPVTSCVVEIGAVPDDFAPALTPEEEERWNLLNEWAQGERKLVTVKVVEFVWAAIIARESLQHPEWVAEPRKTTYQRISRHIALFEHKGYLEKDEQNQWYTIAS